MQPIIEGCARAGDMWSFRSEASDDLNSIYEMLSDIPRCDTKEEILTMISHAIIGLAYMQRRIEKAGTDYLLEDAIE